MQPRLQERVAIVTGASRGIGRAIALRLASEGARVVINFSTNRAAAEEVVAAIDAGGGSALACRADVREQQQVAALVRSALERFGRIDVLVNNAGVEVVGSILELTDEQLDLLTAVHLKGSLHCAQEIAPMLKRQRSGRIINISSIAALGTAVGTIAGYALVKAAVNMFTKRLAFDLGPFNVTVNAVCPGAVRTDMFEDIAARSAEFREFVASLPQRVRLGRMAEPAEIAAVVAFLASDDASFMTGQVLTVDGGRTDLLSHSG